MRSPCARRARRGMPGMPGRTSQARLDDSVIGVGEAWPAERACMCISVCSRRRHMYIGACVCKHASCTCMCVGAHSQARSMTHVRIHTCISHCANTCAYVHACACVRARACARACVDLRIHTCTRIHICTYVHALLHAHKSCCIGSCALHVSSVPQCVMLGLFVSRSPSAHN